MSEQLFPDAVAIDPVVARAPRKRRGFGIAAFILGLVAILGDIVVAIIIFAALSSFGDPLNQTDSAIGFAIGALFASIAAFWGGILLAILSIIFGIIALVRKRGRGFAIIGMLFALITLAVNVTVGVLLLFNAQQFSQFGSLFT